MSRMTINKTTEIQVCIGYTCDICGREVEIPQSLYGRKINTVTHSYPSGGWGERDETEVIDICDSIDCLLKALKKVNFDAEIVLSSQFIKKYQEQ